MRVACTRLGLGAKFVSHDAALGADEQKFRRQLKSSALAPSSSRTKPEQRKKRTAAADVSDEEDVGRTGTFTLRKGGRKRCVAPRIDLFGALSEGRWT